MLLLLFGILDAIAGIILALSGSFSGSIFLFYIGIIMLIKSLYSLGTALAAGFFLDFMGYLDLIASIMLLLAFYGTFAHFFIYIGAILALKGLYSIIMDLISD